MFTGREAADEASEAGAIAGFAARRSGRLERVYRLFARALFCAAREVLGNVDDAQDCVHEALLRIWQRPPAFRPERETLRSYLVVAIRNEAISRKRSASRHLALEERIAYSERQEYEADVPDHVELARLRQAVEALLLEQRVALREIAEKLDVPLGTVKSRVALGLRKLETAFR